MANVKVRINSDGAVELMNSSEVQQYLLKQAQSIASSAASKGNGQYTADVQPGVSRAHARATTADPRARHMEYHHNTLLKSLRAGKS